MSTLKYRNHANAYVSLSVKLQSKSDLFTELTTSLNAWKEVEQTHPDEKVRAYAQKNIVRSQEKIELTISEMMSLEKEMEHIKAEMDGESEPKKKKEDNSHEKE